jgi:hypothetical protein
MKNTKWLKWIGNILATHLIDQLLSPTATYVYLIGSPVVSSILVILSTERLKVALLTQSGSVNQEPLLSILLIALPFLILSFFFGYKFVVWFHIKRKYKFFPSSDYKWKFIVATEEVEQLMYCPKHRRQFVFYSHTNLLRCPQCGLQAPEDFYPNHSKNASARSEVYSLAMKWKHKY